MNEIDSHQSGEKQHVKTGIYLSFGIQKKTTCCCERNHKLY